MKRLLPLLLLLLPACGNDGYVPEPPPPASAAVQAFRDDAVALLRRPELELELVHIQYLMIATGFSGLTTDKPDLSMTDAEARAAELYAKARNGEDFDKLVLTHSYGRLVPGQRPGMFTLTREATKGTTGTTWYVRTIEPRNLWRAAWRLKPGEVGAVERHLEDTPDGYYIVRRLTDEEALTDDPANFDAPNEQVKAMREAAEALMQRPEHNAPRVVVRHLLIARYMSSHNKLHPMLSPAEAEIKAAEVFATALAGDDFEALVRAHTYDQVEGDPGVYAMAIEVEDGDWKTTRRDGMVPAFGDAGWRLQVGEIGVVLYHRARSWYGYHIIQRIE